MKSLLEMLEEDSHLTPAELAVMYEKDQGDIRRMIDEYEQQGVILGYKTVINWERTSRVYYRVDRTESGTHRRTWV